MHDRPENTGYVVQLVCVLVYLLKDVASMATLLIQRYFETDQLRADQRATAPSSPSSTGGQGVVTLIIRWNRKRCDRPDLTVIVIVNVALVALCLQIFHQDLEEKTKKRSKTVEQVWVYF